MIFDKIRKNWFKFFTIFLFIYLIFNVFGGNRGLISYFEKSKLLKSLESEKLKLNYKINSFENKNKLLSEELDLDFIEILIRDKFAFGINGERIYIIKRNEN